MIELDVAEFHIGVIEAAGDKSVTVDCAMMRELITRLRQAEKDAERYRWLRDEYRHEYCVDDLFDGSSISVDNRIDEAMQCNK